MGIQTCSSVSSHPDSRRPGQVSPPVVRRAPTERGRGRRTTRRLVVTTVATVIALLAATPALAGDWMDFVVTNNSSTTLVVEINSAQNCLEPSVLPGFLGARISIPAGFSFVKAVARRDGHGCDGKDAWFGATPIYKGVRHKGQGFYLTGNGEMYMSEAKVAGFTALANQVAAPGPFEWELFMDTKGSASTSAQPAANPFGFSTVELTQASSNLQLAPGYTGNRDDERNVGVGSNAALKTNPGFKWVLERVGDYWIISNLRSGLVLTQDQNRQPANHPPALDLKKYYKAYRNVSMEGRLSPGSSLQQWKLIDGPLVGGKSTYQIVNRASGLALLAERGDAFTSPGSTLADPRFGWKISDGGTYNLAKLTLQSVTAVKVSSGQDANTAALFKAFEIGGQIAAGVASGASSAAVSGALAGAKSAGGVLTKQALKAGAKAVTKKVIFQGAKKGAKTAAKDAAKDLAGAEDLSTLQGLFNKIYGESPDQLKIAANGFEVWPKGGHSAQDTKSQQTQALNIEYVFDASKPLRFELLDEDSGSNDDSLGFVNWNGGSLPVRNEDLLVVQKYQESVYLVSYKIESFPNPKLDNSMLVGQYQSNPIENKSDVGSITESGGKLLWTDQQGIKIVLTPQYEQYRLTLYQQGFKEFDLIMLHNAVVGFEFADKEFTKTRGGARQSPTVVPEAPKPAPAAPTTSAVPPAPVGITLAMVPGTYRRTPALNDWHTGTITNIRGQLKWTNKAGVSWNLTADLADGRLRTGDDNPYYKLGRADYREFTLVVSKGQITGFTFGGQAEVYERQ